MTIMEKLAAETIIEMCPKREHKLAMQALYQSLFDLQAVSFHRMTQAQRREYFRDCMLSAGIITTKESTNPKRKKSNTAKVKGV